MVWCACGFMWSGLVWCGVHVVLYAGQVLFAVTWCGGVHAVLCDLVLSDVAWFVWFYVRLNNSI